MLLQIHIAAQTHGCIGGPGETDSILGVQMIKQWADAARYKLHCPGWQQARIYDHAKGRLGQIAGCRSWLDNRGHAGKQCRGQLFKHAPYREIESIDMKRDPLHRGADMLPHKAALAGQHLDIAVKIDMRIRHLAPTFGGKHKHCANAAINIDPAVGTGGPGHVGQFIKRFFALVQILRQRLQHPRPIMEGHGT